MSEPGVPGADEPDAPGTEDEPTPPGMEEAEDNNDATATTASAAPQEGAVADGATAAATAAPSADAAAAYQYYDQQATAAYPGYGEQYAGYDQYYGYWPGYGDATGYDPYAGYYNQDGTTYAYDPNTYTAPATSAPPADPGTIAPAATQTTADPTIAAPSVAVPLVATASTSVDATPVATAADSPANPAPLTADQTAAAAQSIGAEHAANLLSVDEKQNLELQQEAAETARKEAEERYQKAEEQRRNAKVKADEQAAKAAADYAQAQAEAQAELHRQLQQRLADAQAAAAAQEAEKEKRRVQPVTLKGARLAFNAPKGPAKPAATPPAGDQAGPRKPDMTIKLDPKPQPPPAKPEPKPDAPAPPAKKPGQLYLPQPSTVKNAYLLMAQNKKSSGLDKGGPAPKQASPPKGPPSPARRPSPPRSPPPHRLPSPHSDDDRSRQRNLQEAARRVKGRGNRRYRPEEGMAGEALAPSSMEGGDRRDRDEHRSKHKHHRHHRRHREREPDLVGRDPRQISPDRFGRPSDPAPARYVPPPYDQPPTDAPHTNGARAGQALFPGAFSSYSPPPPHGAPPPQRQQPPSQHLHASTQGYARRHDGYGVPQQQSGMRGYPDAPLPGQGPPRHAPGQAPTQQFIASGLPVLSDSSEDDDLPLPGSTSMRAMSVLQKYLTGSPADAPPIAEPAAAQLAPSAAATTAAASRGHAMTTAASYMPALNPSTQASPLADPRAAGQGKAAPNRAGPAHPPRPLAATPSGYSSDNDPSAMNGASGGVGRKLRGGGGGEGASDDMDMSPIVEQDKGDALDSKALAKLPAQLREAAAAAMARHKAELPKQAVVRGIDVPAQTQTLGKQAQHAKRGQRQYRQRGGNDELDGGETMPESLPNQAAGVAAVTRMQEQEYEARSRAKRARGDGVLEGSEDGRKRSKKHKKHHKKEKRERRDPPSPDPSPAGPPQPHPHDRRFLQPPQDSFNRCPDYPPQQPPRQQQGGQQQGFNRQPGYDQGQGQGQGFQRKPFGQDQGYSGRPGGGPDFLQRQRYPQEGGPGAPPARRRRQFSDRRSPSKSRSRSRSYSRSRSRSYSRSRSRSHLRSRSPRRFNRSVTPPPRRGFGLRADQQGRADGRRPGPGPAPVHGIPPPGSGPAPPPQPPQPYGVPPPVSAFPPSSGAFRQMAPNPLAGMFQPLPVAPPTNPMLLNQQAAAEKAGKAAKRLYVGNIPFDTSQSELTSFFDTIMVDTNALATDTEEQGSAVTSCTLYDRSSAAAGPKAKYAFLNLRSIEETSNCVAFDGVYLKTNALKVRRPDDYDAKKVADLGPSEPSSSLNSLVLAQLKRPPPPPPEPEAPPAPAPALPLATPQGAAPVAGRDVEDGEVGGGVPVTRVLKLEHMVARDELLDEEEYNDIVDDITEEIETKYGHIQNIAIPRPTSAEDQVTSGVGFVFVEFADPAASIKAQKALHGRMFGENQIDASYYSEESMAQKQYI